MVETGRLRRVAAVIGLDEMRNIVINPNRILGSLPVRLQNYRIVFSIWRPLGATEIGICYHVGGSR